VAYTSGNAFLIFPTKVCHCTNSLCAAAKPKQHTQQDEAVAIFTLPANRAECQACLPLWGAAFSDSTVAILITDLPAYSTGQPSDFGYMTSRKRERNKT
jgi:hypothetical protein